ncbi:MAG: hypothetical protein QXL27_05735 [Candidatus Bathyarchaeia archaeon]
MFMCRRCGKRFRDNMAPEYGDAKSALTMIAADLYFKGLSLREMIDGYRAYYNYLRPNVALNEEPPAKGENKWTNVILHQPTSIKRKKIGGFSAV